MKQLVLPIDELQAEAMEHALHPYVVGLDWADYVNWPAYSGRYSHYIEEVLGEFFDGEPESYFIRYNRKRDEALDSTKPWTQLLLPLYGPWPDIVADQYLRRRLFLNRLMTSLPRSDLQMVWNKSYKAATKGFRL